MSDTDHANRAPGLAYRVSNALLHLMGWRVVSVPPPMRQGVVVIYPHTSNWDFIIGVLARSVLNLRMHWVGKHTIFRWPFEGLMRWLGGVPVDRAQTRGFVPQLQSEFGRYDQFFLVITPEGTRKRTENWKSGFYHVAHGLNVPVGLACIDYHLREVGIFEWMTLTGDIEKDMAHIRDVYRGRHGKFPELEAPIRFRE